ncbi:redoxin domain-containing protein [Pelagicoccus sp. NFK12]|uniref:Redoxin domain-containing protein n=1 Tax=Pelagicoccus enzymogenes TaxID=2773457 RepID=A0A927IIC1_9BACT|nr:thioredoxin-like domain-containing protein [Pelagicoccus enzymogenes]MBD5781111.1 redoxin domain-containing protein [Pelagicoccus enzymogenes]
MQIPNSLQRALALSLAIGLTSLLSAQKYDFETLDGETIKADLIGVYNGIVFLEKKPGATQFINYHGLAPESQKVALEWIKTRIAAAGDPPVAAKDSDSKLTQFLVKSLVTNKDGKLEAYAFEDKAEPEFYAFYYSAHWCGPCRRFTPKLRAFYKAMRLLGHDNFEVVFVSSDTSEKMMQRYMEEDQMPWVGVKYSKKSNSRVSRYAGNGIPCLVVTDRHGRLLYHSYQNGEYIGPSVPLTHLENLLNYTAKLEAMKPANEQPEDRS